MKKIYDCFTFFNELDLLEIRLEEEYSFVDKFIICESRQTFQGKDKPLYFEENKARYERFADKINHIILNNLPDSGNPWDREHFQRNHLRTAIIDAAPDDIIIISDADEIISPKALQILKFIKGFIQLDMPMFQYYINLQAQPNGWNKPFAFSRDMLDEIPDFNFPRTNQNEVFANFGDRASVINDAGWHFTYLGGADQIRTKLNSFSHTDGWHEYMRQPGAVERHIQIGYVVGNFWHLARYVPLGPTFPKTIIEWQHKPIVKKYLRDIYEALQSIQDSFREFDHQGRKLFIQYHQARTKYAALLKHFDIQPFDEEQEIHTGDTPPL